MSAYIPICVAYGDGVGPEIMEAAIKILKEVKAPLRLESIEIGENLYKQNYSSGISDSAWDVIKRNRVLLKGPITTPQGGGYKSLNVTLRKKLGLYANVRPSKSLYPFVRTNFPNMDLVIIRENEEDLYTGIEYRQTLNSYESLKLISARGSRRISKFAFDYAKKNDRHKITCFSKDNIMKFTDGIFHKSFNDIAAQNKDIESAHQIIDIGAAKLASDPVSFDMIVTSNLYGDIISDVASEISGSVGMSGSANIGDNYAMFEAVHGSATDIEGQDIANPSGIINASIMMLVHLGLFKEAETIENAWKKTLEDGFHTADIYSDDISFTKAGTKEFTQEVIKNLGKKPQQLKEANYNNYTIKHTSNYKDVENNVLPKKLVGIDVYIDWETTDPSLINKKLLELDNFGYKIYSISTKGLKIWPAEDYKVLTHSIEHWALRIQSDNKKDFTHQDIIKILNIISSNEIDFIKVENLYNFGQERGYSLAQGE